MLVLTRKQQERVHIGDNIFLTIVRIKGNTVRVGIEAPSDVRIVRGEVAEREKAAELPALSAAEQEEQPVMADASQAV